jgi:DNA-directed RNA polymerase specialized sigma24 family protein
VHASDSHIVWWNAFKQGDWNAYTSLYEEFYKPLNNYGAKFTGDADLVQDAIHDLFVQLWTSRNNLGAPASVKNYLFKSLRTTGIAQTGGGPGKPAIRPATGDRFSPLL